MLSCVEAFFRHSSETRTIQTKKSLHSLQSDFPLLLIAPSWKGCTRAYFGNGANLWWDPPRFGPFLWMSIKSKRRRVGIRHSMHVHSPKIQPIETFVHIATEMETQRSYHSSDICLCWATLCRIKIREQTVFHWSWGDFDLIKDRKL